ncbi:hypothetical protein GCM10027168_67910 [Streptomyces capparidis]
MFFGLALAASSADRVVAASPGLPGATTGGPDALASAPPSFPDEPEVHEASDSTAAAANPARTRAE